MTAIELILDCLKRGLDAEKVDYEVIENYSEPSRPIQTFKFETGAMVRIRLESLP